jgi:hypothetical protein
VKSRLSQPFAVALILVCAAFLTPAALAGGGKPKHHKKASDCGVSASCVYVEHYKTGGGSVAAGSQIGPTLKLSNRILEALRHDRKLAKHHAKQVAVLNELVTNPGKGAERVQFQESSDQMIAPNALGAAFDLGTGPIALFAALLAGAVLGAGAMALRRRNRSTPPSSA